MPSRVQVPPFEHAQIFTRGVSSERAFIELVATKLRDRSVGSCKVQLKLYMVLEPPSSSSAEFGGKLPSMLA